MQQDGSTPAPSPASPGPGDDPPVDRVPAAVKPLVPLLPYQKADIERDARFNWSCWSRQVGKSFTKSLRRILRGLQRGRTQIFLSAGQRQAVELLEKARRHCRALQIACDGPKGGGYFRDTSYKRLEITLPNRVRIIALPANPQTARGFTGDVLLDEFAMHRDDRAIWAALFPALLRGDGELDIASTPKGCSNLFYELRGNPQFAHSTVTLPEAAAQGLDVDVEETRRAIADEWLFRQEFLCEFLDEAAAFLTYAQIAACEDAHLERRMDVARLSAAGGDLYAGVDIGRRHDLTVIWVLQQKGDALVTLGVAELGNVPFRQQYAALSDVLRAPGLRRCCMDAGGVGMQLAEAAIEDFGRHRVEAVTLTSAVKAQIAGRLRILVEEGRIRIPASEAIRNDWHSIKRLTTATGHVRLDAARTADGHADRFWAAALAVAATDQAPGPAEWFQGQPLHFGRHGAW